MRLTPDKAESCSSRTKVNLYQEVRPSRLQHTTDPPVMVRARRSCRMSFDDNRACRSKEGAQALVRQTRDAEITGPGCQTALSVRL